MVYCYGYSCVGIVLQTIYFHIFRDYSYIMNLSTVSTIIFNYLTITTGIAMLVLFCRPDIFSFSDNMIQV